MIVVGNRFRFAFVCLNLISLPALIVCSATGSAIAQSGSDDRRDSSDRRERRRDWRRDRSNPEDDRDSRSERSSMRTTPALKADDEPGIGMESYAKSLVKQYDKNGNMMLEGDERSGLKGKAAAADLNKDGVTTVDELVAGLSTNASIAGEPPGLSQRDKPAGSPGLETTSEGTSSDRGSAFSFGRRDRDRDSDDGRSTSGGKDATDKRVYLGSAAGQAESAKEKKRHSYRFTPSAERLPTGLPSWFKSRDGNGDGQIAMSEYSRSWSSRTVAEFRRYDQNDDGIITAKEVKK